ARQWHASEKTARRSPNDRPTSFLSQVPPNLHPLDLTFIDTNGAVLQVFDLTQLGGPIWSSLIHWVGYSKGSLLAGLLTVFPAIGFIPAVQAHAPFSEYSCSELWQERNSIYGLTTFATPAR